MSEALVKVGDILKVSLPSAEAKNKDNEKKSNRVKATVVSVKKAKKEKDGWKYQLQIGDEIVKTKLDDMEWKLVKSSPTELSSKSKKRSREEVENHNEQRLTVPKVLKTSKLTPALTAAIKYTLAPMVNASELAFRLLCRKYGATLAYTPMINSEKFAVDAEYRKEEFQTTPQDRPLVAHFSANNAELFLQAVKHVEKHCDAIGKHSLLLSHYQTSHVFLFIQTIFTI